MSSTATQTQSRPSGQRGRGGNRNRRGNRGGSRAPKGLPATTPSKAEDAVTAIEQTIESAQERNNVQAPEVEDGDLCFICAEPIKYYSVSQCNHRTCHVCALRLRALYKKLDCTFCKDPQPSVIFTISPDAPFSSYMPVSIPLKDVKLSIYFETEEMMEETLLLLRFNCPDPDCDYIATGWGDLKLHVRGAHGKMMCDLCIRFKKVFSHEHALYPPGQLSLHLPSIPHRSYKSQPKDQIEGGIHPLCEFCRECLFSDDELYAHMREKHEECFICKRNEVRDQYFQNYESLERHFNNAHHPCTQAQCLARKFVVFNTVLDLKAHMVEEHGTDMTARDKKDARRIQADFEFEEVGGAGRRGRRDRGDREREREPPPPHQPAAPISGPSRPTGRRRDGFGASLTVDGGTNSSPNHVTPELSRRPTPSPPRGDVDPDVAERHAAFNSRVRSLAPNYANAVAAVGTAIRGYRGSETSARDLISTIWNIVDRSLEDTASLINALVDLLDDEDKKTDLLGSWNGFKIEQQRQFPDLVPTSIGSGYAGIASGRVLNVKHSAASRSSNQSSRQVWDRVAQAAGSTSSSASPAPVPRPPDRFPPLHPAGPSVVTTFRQPQRNTPWASSKASVAPRGPSSVPGPGAVPRNEARTSSARPAPPALSKSLFPDLPTSGTARPKAQVSGNQSLKKILGESAASPSAWGGSNGTSPSTSAPASAARTPDESSTVGDVDGPANGSGGGKGKKGKGKQKQTLFTLGSFPT